MDFEPSIIDYYNEMPVGANVIEKMNEELSVVQEENESLKARIKYLEDMDKLRNPEKILIEGKDIEKYIEAENTLEEELMCCLSEAKTDNGDDEFKLDMKYIFDHKQDYVEILMRYSKQSKEWCTHRVRTCFKEYIPLNMVDHYWWDNMIKGEQLCDDIIERISYYLIVGENEECEVGHGPEMGVDIRNIYTVKCDMCHKCLPYLVSSYNEDTKISECNKCCIDDDDDY